MRKYKRVDGKRDGIVGRVAAGNLRRESGLVPFGEATEVVPTDGGGLSPCHV